MKTLDHYWGSVNTVSLLLLPLAWLFCLLAWLRRLSYRLDLARVVKIPVPVIIVGNITVGGAGKTPLVIWLAGYLKRHGFKPGIISRGYGGSAGHWPQAVTSGSSAARVGDEPVLIADRTRCPMWVGPDRPQAALALLESSDCDIIISDDGMQHYALDRDIEIAVIDTQRGLGNGWCLPAGPLRERASRLSEVDIQVFNGQGSGQAYEMHLNPTTIRHLRNREQVAGWDSFGGGPVHAVAGIGNPVRFFDLLRSRGLEVIEHIFPDHHPYTAGDIIFDDQLPVLMTEKDAVKCVAIAGEQHWFLEVSAELNKAFEARLDELIKGLANG